MSTNKICRNFVYINLILILLVKIQCKIVTFLDSMLQPHAVPLHSNVCNNAGAGFYNWALIRLAMPVPMKSFLVAVFVSCIAISCAVATSHPALSSLQSAFVAAYPPDRDLPVTCNFWGCTGSEGLSSLSGLQVYPYSLRNIQVSGGMWVGSRPHSCLSYAPP